MAAWPVRLLLLLGLALAAGAQPLYFTIGPQTADRPDGIWPRDTAPDNGTAAPAQPYVVNSISESLLTCQRIRIPAPGMDITSYGIFIQTPGKPIRLFLYATNATSVLPAGLPLRRVQFTSVAGRNDVNLTGANPLPVRMPWSSLFGYIWLCVLVDDNAVYFYETAGTYGVDVVQKSYAWTGNPGDYDWIGFSPETQKTTKLNVYIYGPSNGTWTPTATATATASPTTTASGTPLQTRSLTPTATTTGTASPTATKSPSPTAVPTYDPQHYVYNGVPTPQEVLTVPWVDFFPHTALAGEEITAQVTGWHNFWDHEVDFKVGRGSGYDDCYGVQEGSSLQRLVNGTIKLRALRPDTYRVCYWLRNDWEPLERRFEVTQPVSTAPFWGYDSCAAVVANSPPGQYCGCFIGTAGERVHVRDSFP
eukprot:EG_transcript_14058